MKITYNGEFTFTDEQKSLLEAYVKDACGNQGYNYSAEIRLSPNFEMLVITVYPPDSSHFVSFHILDIQRMSEILGMNFRFCKLFNGRLELIFMK